MKRIMCLLLALVMVFSLVGVSAFAADDETDAEETASEETADPAAESEEEDSSEEPEDEQEDEADAEETEEIEESNAGIMLMSSGSSDTVTVPVTVTGDSDGIYSWSDYSEITVGRSYSIQIKAGYDIEVTGATVTSRGDYRLDSDGNVYRPCYFTVSEEDYVEGMSVTVKIVASSEEAPTAVKVTTVLPEGATEDDVYSRHGPSAYVLSNDSTSLTLAKGYEVTATGADLMINPSEGTEYTIYYIYPHAGINEITITITAVEGGTLAVTGESAQIVSIQDADGNDVTAGSKVESTDILSVIVNQGYVVTGGSLYRRNYETGVCTYSVAVEDITENGIATLNIEQGVIVKVVSEAEPAAAYTSITDGYTCAVGDTIDISVIWNYVAEFSGAGVSVTAVGYDCNSTDGTIAPYYTVTTSSAGTLTVSIRQAKDGELPTAIPVEYIDEYDVLIDGPLYVLPGNYFSVTALSGYTFEVEGATIEAIYVDSEWDSWSSWNGQVDNDTTAVKVTIVPIVENATLEIVDESGADASAAAIKVDAVDSVMAGDTLEADMNYLCLANGYEIANVEGATYYEVGYDMADDGTIYVRYALVPTGDPSTVQVTVVEKAVLATVTIVNNGIYAYVSGYEEKISNTEYTMLSANELWIELNGYTVRVTGGVVNTEKSYAGSSYYCYYYIQPTSENVTVEIISFEDLAKILGDSADGAIAVDATNDPAQQPTEGNNNPGGTTPGSDQPSDKPDDKPDAQPDSKPDAKPDGEAGGASGEAPKTGDEANATLWAVLVGAFAVSAGAVLTVLKKKNN